jgi:hypothetical protein
MWDDGVPVTILSWKRLYRDYVSRASVPMTQWPDGLTRLQDQASTLQQLMAWLAEISWIVSGTHESETLQLIDGHFTLLYVDNQLGEKSGESKDHGVNPRGYVLT